MELDLDPVNSVIKRFRCTLIIADRGSLIECASAWYADGRGFVPHVQQHSFVEFGHEIISMAMLSLPLIQEEQLSVTGERMRSLYW